MLSRLPLMTRIVLAGLVLALVGCGVDSGTLGPETDDSGYRDAKQLENEGRMDEALAAYLKVIARRGEDAAPESHLDAAGIYLNYVKDPIYAIYHFRKYLELEPNSRQAQAVKGQIEAARREFARTIPGWQQADSATAQIGVPDDTEAIRRENTELKAELATLRASQGLPAVVNHSSTDLSGADQGPSEPPPAETPNPIKLAPMEQPPIQPVASTDQSEATVTPTAPPPRASNKPSGGGRTYTVVHGDTWVGLARKFYGNPSRWREISAANGNMTTLRIGAQIRIP